MKLKASHLSTLFLLSCVLLTVGKPATEDVDSSKEGSDSEKSVSQSTSSQTSDTDSEKGSVISDDSSGNGAQVNGNQSGQPSIATKPNATYAEDKNCTGSNVNDSDCTSQTGIKGYYNSIINTLSENRGMVKRTFFVLIGVTGIIILYFVVKTYRLRKRKSKSRKYGVISTRGDDTLEMTPLDQDDDDEDMTVFEINGHPK